MGKQSQSKKREPLPPKKYPDQSDLSRERLEQQLDMSDEYGENEEQPDRINMELDELLYRYGVDMSELNREGDERTGDEHSSGLQGGDSELEWQIDQDSGLPGDLEHRENMFEQEDFEEYFEEDKNLES